MAAYRAGVKTVILPEDNVPDLDEIDPTVRAGLRFVPVAHMDMVLKEALAEKKMEPAVLQKPEEAAAKIPQHRKDPISPMIRQ